MKVQNLYFQHAKGEPPFFEDISFELEPGFLHALYGKNGTGKTVLMHLLAGKKTPSRGEIIGNEKAAFVNQRFDQMLADGFTFEENLKFAGIERFPSLFSPLKPPLPSLSLVKQFHIDPKTPVKNLSGGQRQILALLMVLQRKGGILLLDEPTATLDAQNAKEVFEFLEALAKQGMTLLVVCHDQELIDEYTSGRRFHLTRESSGVRRLHRLDD
jgi:ABC-type multidrug transport system ATPase subunit